MIHFAFSSEISLSIIRREKLSVFHQIMIHLITNKLQERKNV